MYNPTADERPLTADGGQVFMLPKSLLKILRVLCGKKELKTYLMQFFIFALKNVTLSGAGRHEGSLR